jgi:TonB family protein
MIATIVLTGITASLAFVLAAYLAERALHAVRLPTRFPWIVASVVPALLPLAQVLVLSLPGAAQTGGDAGAAQVLPLTTILTATAVERLGATTAAALDVWLLASWACATVIVGVRLVSSARSLGRAAHAWRPAEVAGVNAWISTGYGPAVVGLRDPRIVVPQRIAQLTLEEQRLAVAHELEHIAKRDQWWLYAAALSPVIVPWNPLAWFAIRRLRSAIEVDCDARVLRKEPNVAAYASLVLNVASWPREALTGALAMGDGAAGVAQLERRLRIMTSRSTTRRLTRAALSLAGAAALGVYGCEVAVNVDRPDQPEKRQARGELRGQEMRVSTNEVHTLPKVVTTGAAAPSADAERPFFEFQVDKPVTTAPGSASPRYPQILRQAGVEGEVLVQFVVDTDGRAEPATFKVLRSSHDLFAASVAKALPAMRFIPAEFRGRRVRQLVQQPFAYTIAR